MNISDKIEDSDLSRDQKNLYFNLFTEKNFTAVEMLGKLAYPFYVLVKIFEKNNSRQYLVVPLYEMLEEHFNLLLQNNDIVEYHSTILEFLNQINVRKKKTLHWELLMASYSLTAQGRLWLRKLIAKTNPAAISITTREKRFEFKKIKLDYTIIDDGDLDRIEIDYDMDERNEDGDFSAETLVTQELTRLESGSGDQTLQFRNVNISHTNVPLPPTHTSGVFSSIVETLKDVSRKINDADNNIL